MSRLPIVTATAIPSFPTIDVIMNRYTHLLIATVMLSLTTTGCHRQYYRQQADNEVHALIAEKSSHVARPPDSPVRIEVDRRSRMFNPFDLDFQPLPLDDPASYRYMQCVDGRRGYPMWEAAGITNTTESPDWWQFLPLDENGVLVLNSENAVRIAMLHSPEYQRQVEQLYLSALNVSAQRFEFDTQFNFGLGGDVTSGGGTSPAYTFGPNNLTMNRRLAWGGNLVAGVANSIVWDLSGANTQSANTLLDFTLLQPLLRGAGRDIVLEQLTQAERSLLADVRSFERFRRAFFLNVTVGRALESQVNTGGQVAVNANAFGGVGGFLGLLQTQLQIRNQQENIARQNENLLLNVDQLVEYLTTIPDNADTIIRQRLQVAQARQRVLGSQNTLISQQANYQRDLDSFLRNLGLPPYICARIEDTILDQFELIDRALLSRREQLAILRTNVGMINVSILELEQTDVDPVTNLPQTRITWTPEVEQKLNSLLQELLPLADFNRTLIEADLPVIAEDIEHFEQSLAARKRQSEELLKLYRTEQESVCSLVGVTSIDESIFELDELSTLSAELKEKYVTLEMGLSSYQSRIGELEQTLRAVVVEGPQEADTVTLSLKLREIILDSQNLLAEMADDVLAVQLIQARARTESVLLPEVAIDPEDAFQIARKNRRDWANARASLVDSWRSIEVVADQLESQLDVVFSGELGNVGNSPFKLSKNQGQIRVGLQWDAPIVRLQERNDYRATLIAYEQARRRYYAFEDGIWQLLRAEIRQLRVNRFNFELGRQAIRSAASQVELNADIRLLNEARGTTGGPTAARDAIDALNDLLNAQNNLLFIFVNYEVVRRGLDFDLGTMELTPEGLWIDPGKISPETLLTLPGTTIDGMIECGCNDCGLTYDPLPAEPVFDDAMLGVHHLESAVDEIPFHNERVPDNGFDSIEELPMPITSEELPLDSEELPPPNPVPLQPRTIDGQLLP